MFKGLEVEQMAKKESFFKGVKSEMENKLADERRAI